MKWSSLLLALLFLGACDGDDLPSQPGPPAAPEVQPSVDRSAATAPVQRETDTPPKIEIELEPVTAGDPEELPSERVVPAAESKPVSAAPKKKVAVEQIELPEPELDLSLPEDWAEELEPAQDAEALKLLPPLFEPGEDSRSVQMSGSLLPGLERDDALIDGAQINFELKR
ncbi:hypothetical protein NA647_02320 [Pseudomonas stutzeri]|uniref:hypothetical protein n=1 Tax=Stutzerimonas stutzeri TaxID=316 RepID=UPI00210D0285|nr:hypothetical protein [Stutzerimonas stutzeri]MCQ4286272.1 hypothetical protein [Stutzerimonas stutzeri]